MLKRKSLFFKNLQYMLLLNVVNRVISSLTIFVISLFFPPELYGKYVWVTTIVSYFAILCDLGIETYAQREVAERSTIGVIDIFYTRLILSLASFISCFLYLFTVSRNLLFDNLFYLIPFYLVFFCLQFSWLFAGKQKFRPVLVGAFFQNLASLCIVLAGMLLKKTELISLGLVVSYLCSGGYFLWQLKKLNISLSGWKAPRLKLIWKIVAGSFSLGLSRTFTSFAVSFDVYLIGIFLPFSQVGGYFIVFKIIGLAAIPALSIAAVLQPTLSDVRTNEQKGRATIRKTFLLMLLTAFVCSSGLLLTGNNLFRIFYKNKYGDVSMLFALLGLRLFFVYLSYFFSTVLVTYRRDRQILTITLISSIVSIGLDLFIIPKMGINGAAMVSLLTEALACIGYLLVAFPYTLESLFSSSRINVMSSAAVVLLLIQSAVIMSVSTLNWMLVIAVGLLMITYGGVMIKKMKYE